MCKWIPNSLLMDNGYSKLRYDYNFNAQLKKKHYLNPNIIIIVKYFYISILILLRSKKIRNSKVKIINVFRYNN